MDISQASVLEAVAARVNLNGAELLNRSEADDIKAKLRANTDELIARGGFGSPTIFINVNDMYFGNDRLPLVEAALSVAG
jgi:2-hydroxychromene-2-carboxylate isomerase